MVETILAGPALFDLSQTMAGTIFDGTMYAWEALPRIKDFIQMLAAKLPADFEKIGDAVWVGKGYYFQIQSYSKKSKENHCTGGVHPRPRIALISRPYAACFFKAKAFQPNMPFAI